MQSQIPLKEGELRMPDGTKTDRESMEQMLVDAVAEEFRAARKGGAYMTKDWIRYAAQQVVSKVFELDAYMEQMLELQKHLVEKKKSLLGKVADTLKGGTHEEEKTE